MHRDRQTEQIQSDAYDFARNGHYVEATSLLSRAINRIEDAPNTYSSEIERAQVENMLGNVLRVRGAGSTGRSQQGELYATAEETLNRSVGTSRRLLAEFTQPSEQPENHPNSTAYEATRRGVDIKELETTLGQGLAFLGRIAMAKTLTEAEDPIQYDLARLSFSAAHEHLRRGNNALPLMENATQAMLAAKLAGREDLASIWGAIATRNIVWALRHDTKHFFRASWTLVSRMAINGSSEHDKQQQKQVVLHQL